MTVRILVGDALQEMAKLSDASIDAVITDPPYCSGALTEAGKARATHQGLRSEAIRTGRFTWFEGDNMTTAGLAWLLREMAVEAVRVLKPTGHLLVFVDWRMVPTLAPAIESAGLRLRNIVVWDKGNFGTGIGFRPVHELILHFARGEPEFHAANVGNVIRVPRVRSADRDHPTEKPLELLQKLIRVTTPPAGVVLDPFAGSGTTGVAADLEGRDAVLIERDAGYVAVSERRLEGTSGPMEIARFRNEGKAVDPGPLFAGSSKLEAAE